MLVLGGVVLYGVAGAIVLAIGRAGSQSRPWQVEKVVPLKVVR
jgi:hypothetical protein